MNTRRTLRRWALTVLLYIFYTLLWIVTNVQKILEKKETHFSRN